MIRDLHSAVVTYSAGHEIPEPEEDTLRCSRKPGI